MFTLLHNLYKYCKKRREREVSIVIIGLDNAGKSTLLSVLKGAVDHSVTPTWGFTSETIAEGRHKVTYFDLGGGKKIRGIWPRYFSEVYGVIYIVDSADTDRLAESKDALFSSIDDSRLAGKPILIVANKQDLPNAQSADAVALSLGLDTVRKSSYRIVGGVARTLPGSPIDPNLAKGMRWMMDMIQNNFEELSVRVQKQTEEQRALEKKEADERRARVEKMREERRRQQELEEREELERAAKDGKQADVELGSVAHASDPKPEPEPKPIPAMQANGDAAPACKMTENPSVENEHLDVRIETAPPAPALESTRRNSVRSVASSSDVIHDVSEDCRGLNAQGLHTVSVSMPGAPSSPATKRSSLDVEDSV
eukprot:ANDGO_03082.mRNA.1 ADP-ribosylation factor-like protein 13B